MRIVHLTASTFFGGPERQMLGLAGALPTEFTTSFLSFSEGGRCRPFLTAARASGFDAAELNHDTPRFAAATWELTAFLRGNFADVVITHGYKSNLLGRPAARRAGIPIISVSRGWTGENLKVRCYEALDRVHLRLMDRVVCVSSGQAQRVRWAGVRAENVHVIRNAAPLAAFTKRDPAIRDRVHELSGGRGPIIMGAGRLSPEKGFHVLVEAARYLLEKHPRARIIILGEGPDRSMLERRATQLGLGNRLRFPGFRDDLDDLLPWADVVVLPSFTEGLPNIALEAAAAKVPIVATAVGGTPEVVIENVTGFLVPPGDPVALASQIGNLLRDSGLAQAFGAAGRRHVEEHFSFEGQAGAYQALFEELVPAPAGSRARVICA